MNDLTELPETQLVTPSENSRAWLSKQMENLTAMTSASDVLKQFARLAANYGDSRISTPEQRTLLLREWLEAFGKYSPAHLHEAVSTAMKATKFWPTIAEVEAEASALRREAVSFVGHATGTGRHVATPTVFERDGRTEAEEIIFRAAAVKRMKAEARAKMPEQPDPMDALKEAKPASQDQGVSFALLNSCAGRRSKGLETCSYDCSRRMCEMRLV